MAANNDGLPVRTGFLGWLNKRLPVDAFVRDQLTGYFAPKNFNFWYFFGVLSLVALVIQLVTGIFLTMHYKVGETTAFDSVQYIMREVPYGWHAALHAFHWRVGVLHRRLPAHVPRLPVRLVQGAARTAVAVRHVRVPGADGGGLHGLRAALGQHVLLGCAGHRESVRHGFPSLVRAWSSGSAATTASRMPR